MSRRRKSILRKINPDPKYGSVELSKFINRLMKGGKKSVARKAVYLAIDKLENQIKRPGLELFEEAMKNTMPTLEVKPRRVGGATYQVPVEIRPKRRVALAHRWIVEAARRRDAWCVGTRCWCCLELVREGAIGRRCTPRAPSR